MCVCLTATPFPPEGLFYTTEDKNVISEKPAWSNVVSNTHTALLEHPTKLSSTIGLFAADSLLRLSMMSRQRQLSTDRVLQR